MAEQDVLGAVYEHVLGGEAELAVAETEAGLREGTDPRALLFDAMIPALEEVGIRFESGVYFLPEMLVAARAMQASMDVLRPYLAGAERPRLGTYVIGTVAGDIHDIGKNLCSVMLEGVGFEVIDLGTNVSGLEFVEAIRRHRPELVGMSAFLTTTVPEVERTIALLSEENLRDAVKVMVGGAPVNERLAADLGADGYAPDASSAARAAKALLEQAQ